MSNQVNQKSLNIFHYNGPRIGSYLDISSLMKLSTICKAHFIKSIPKYAISLQLKSIHTITFSEISARIKILEGRITLCDVIKEGPKDLKILQLKVEDLNGMNGRTALKLLPCVPKSDQEVAKRLRSLIDYQTIHSEILNGYNPRSVFVILDKAWENTGELLSFDITEDEQKALLALLHQRLFEYHDKGDVAAICCLAQIVSLQGSGSASLVPTIISFLSEAAKKEDSKIIDTILYGLNQLKERWLTFAFDEFLKNLLKDQLLKCTNEEIINRFSHALMMEKCLNALCSIDPLPPQLFDLASPRHLARTIRAPFETADEKLPSIFFTRASKDRDWLSRFHLMNFFPNFKPPLREEYNADELLCFYELRHENLSSEETNQFLLFSNSDPEIDTKKAWLVCGKSLSHSTVLQWAKEKYSQLIALCKISNAYFRIPITFAQEKEWTEFLIQKLPQLSFKEQLEVNSLIKRLDVTSGTQVFPTFALAKALLSDSIKSFSMGLLFMIPNSLVLFRHYERISLLEQLNVNMEPAPNSFKISRENDALQKLTKEYDELFGSLGLEVDDYDLLSTFGGCCFGSTLQIARDLLPVWNSATWEDDAVQLAGAFMQGATRKAYLTQIAYQNLQYEYKFDYFQECNSDITDSNLIAKAFALKQGLDFRFESIEEEEKIIELLSREPSQKMDRIKATKPLTDLLGLTLANSPFTSSPVLFEQGEDGIYLVSSRVSRSGNRHAALLIKKKGINYYIDPNFPLAEDGKSLVRITSVEEFIKPKYSDFIESDLEFYMVKKFDSEQNNNQSQNSNSK